VPEQARVRHDTAVSSRTSVMVARVRDDLKVARQGRIMLIVNR
jgi:hypothetical protein